MRIALLIIFVAGCAAAQSPKLPPDVDPQSLSRLPLLPRDRMTGDAIRVYDLVVGKDASGKERPAPSPGLQADMIYSPGVAEPMNRLNRYLRNSVVGYAMFEIAALTAARELDSTFLWAGHEATARAADVDPKTIDAIRLNRGIDGLPENDALVIRFGRALFRDHALSPELYARVVEVFGKQGMFELAAMLGDYAMGSVILNAVDQHHPGSPPELPPIRR